MFQAEERSITKAHNQPKTQKLRKLKQVLCRWDRPEETKLLGERRLGYEVLHALFTLMAL